MGHRAFVQRVLASVAATGSGLLWLGEEKQVGMALVAPVVSTHPGFPGAWAHSVVGGHWLEQKEKWLLPSLSAELAALVSKNIKICH